MYFTLFASYCLWRCWCSGKYVSGSRRWLVLGPMTLQPSEVVKLAVIVVLAKYYAKVVRTEGLYLKELVTPAILTGVPFALIVRQPDLGTAMVVALIAVSITLYAKIERRTLSWLVAACALGVPLVWSLLKGYQKQRIMTFLNPDRDPLGAGYHVIQSKIAIGSGMLTGKGFLKGTQNALDFLPEQHTDFIFSVLAEEWGPCRFAGAPHALYPNYNLGIADRPAQPGSIWHPFGRGCDFDDFLAGFHKYWHGHGVDAGRRGNLAVYQLWGVFHHHDDGRCRTVAQCEHEAVHVRAVMGTDTRIAVATLLRFGFD